VLPFAAYFGRIRLKLPLISPCVRTENDNLRAGQCSTLVELQNRARKWKDNASRAAARKLGLVESVANLLSCSAAEERSLLANWTSDAAPVSRRRVAALRAAAAVAEGKKNRGKRTACSTAFDSSFGRRAQPRGAPGTGRRARPASAGDAPRPRRLLCVAPSWSRSPPFAASGEPGMPKHCTRPARAAAAAFAKVSTWRPRRRPWLAKATYSASGGAPSRRPGACPGAGGIYVFFLFGLSIKQTGREGDEQTFPRRELRSPTLNKANK